MLARLVLAAFLIVSLACTQRRAQKTEPEGYRVIAYDARTHQWTILRTGTFDGKYLRKRLTVVCSFWKWGDREPVIGPEACHLQVGRLMIPNQIPRGKFLDIFEMADETLSITEGDPTDQVAQHFSILKYEVLPDSDGQ
jgi:hypothetical protein